MIKECPYKGLVPYGEEDARYFFGRDRERRLISASLRASRLTVLYGESGAGKSSVLSAGVAHDLREDSDFALVLFRNWRDDPLFGLLNAVSGRLSKLRNSPPKRYEEKPGALLQQWSEASKRGWLIVLDQFEEYFQYHPGEQGQGKLADELPRLLSEPNLPVNFLIAIREDALGMLDRFKGAIPNLFDNLIRIEHLSRRSAEEAIIKPLQNFNEDIRAGKFLARPDHLHPIEIEERVAAQTVSAILQAQGGGQERVQAPYLQLVMTRWWEREIESNSQIMSLSVLQDLGGVKTIVERYLEDTLATFSPQEKEVLAEVFRYMVTPTGRKIAQTTTDLSNNLPSFFSDPSLRSLGATAAASLEEIMKKLQEARLLRKVPPPLGSQPDEACYEFSHDVVAKAAFEWRKQFRRAQQLAEAERKEREANQRAEEQARLAETERQLSVKANLLAEESAKRAAAESRRAEEQTRQAKRFRILSAALIIISAIALFLGARQLQNALVAAKAERRRADDQAQQTQQQTQIAAVVVAGLGGVVGIDVSSNQGQVDWRALKKAGISFCLVRATLGAESADSRFAANWAAMRDAGIIRGAYHFFWPFANGADQAQSFLNAVKIQPGDLPPALDVEPIHSPDGRPLAEPSQILSGIARWLEVVEERTGRRPMIYTYSSYWQSLGNPKQFARYPLWVAQYGSAQPRLFGGWQKWTFWQFTENEQVGGIITSTALNRYNGSMSDLQAFVRGEKQ